MSLFVEDDSWPGIPCSSPGWALTMETCDFLARRAIVSISAWQTTDGKENPAGRRLAAAENLRAARRLRESLREQERIIAAEAIHRGIPFSIIGAALSMGKTGAHKAYASFPGELPPVSCLAPEWRAGPRDVTPARNAIRQGVNVTAVELPESAGGIPREWLGLLTFLKSARSLRSAADQAEKDVVAELRFLEVPWKDIGNILGSSTTTTQKKFGDGLSARRLKRLAHERAAFDLLETGHGDPDEYDGMTVGRSMRFALQKFKAVRSSTADYVAGLLNGSAASAGRDDDARWQAETANRIAQAVMPVMVPGVCGMAVEAMRKFEELAEGDGVEYAVFTLYLFFLFALSFSYVAELFKITMDQREPAGPLTDAEAEACFESAVAGAGVAKLAVEIAEALLIDDVVGTLADRESAVPPGHR